MENAYIQQLSTSMEMANSSANSCTHVPASSSSIVPVAPTPTAIYGNSTSPSGSLIKESEIERHDVVPLQLNLMGRRRSSAISLPQSSYSESVVLDSPVGSRSADFSSSISPFIGNAVGDLSVVGSAAQPDNLPNLNNARNDRDGMENGGGFFGVPKPIHECDACGKQLCSTRSLKRHKATCKRIKTLLDRGDYGDGEKLSQKTEKSNDKKSVHNMDGLTSASKGNIASHSASTSSLTMHPQEMEQIQSARIFVSGNTTQVAPVFDLTPSASFYSQKSGASHFSTTHSSTQAAAYFHLADKEQLVNNTTETKAPAVDPLQYSHPSMSGVQINTEEKNTDSDGQELRKVSDVVDSVVERLRQQSSSNIMVKTEATVAAQAQQQNLGGLAKKQQNKAISAACISTELTSPREINDAFFPTDTHPRQQRHFAQAISNSSFAVPQQQMHLSDPSRQEVTSNATEQRQFHQMQIDATSGEQGPPKSAPAVGHPTIAQQQQFCHNVPPQSAELGKYISSPPPYPYRQPHYLNQPQQTPNSNSHSPATPKEFFLQSPPIQQHGISCRRSGTAENDVGDGGTGSAAPMRNVYRYLCPECDKPYSCRKNVKRHRVSQHGVSLQEAQEGTIKRIKLAESEIAQMGGSAGGASCTQKKSEPKRESLDRSAATQQKEEMCGQANEHANTSQCRAHEVKITSSKSSVPTGGEPAYHQLRPEGPPPQSAPAIGHTEQNQQFFLAYQTPQQYAQQMIPHVEQTQHQFNRSYSLEMMQQQHSYYPPPQQPYAQHPPLLQQYSFPPALPNNQQQRTVQPQCSPDPSAAIYPHHTLAYDPHPQQQRFETPLNLPTQHLQQHFVHQHRPQKQEGASSPFFGHQSMPHSAPPYRIGQTVAAGCYPAQSLTQHSYRSENNSTNDIGHPSSSSSQFHHSQQQPSHSANGGNTSYRTHQQGDAPAATAAYSETLDCWEQIKSGVDAMPTSDADAIEMARIVEDLKRTEEAEEMRHRARIEQQRRQAGSFFSYGPLPQSTSKSTLSGQQQHYRHDALASPAGIGGQQQHQRKAVELAEADTTFSPPAQPEESTVRLMSTANAPIQHPPVQQQPSLVQHRQSNDASFDYPQLQTSTHFIQQQQLGTNQQLGGGGEHLAMAQQEQQAIQLAQSKEQNIAVKGKKASKFNAANAPYSCPHCNRGLSTDYSLKRHQQCCPKLVGKGGGRKRVGKNGKVAKRQDEQHQIDPDSTMNESLPDEGGNSSAAFAAAQMD